jgi:hypothetical protein
MPNNKVKQAIRFALSNLRSQNDHHLFEKLCFDVVKQKIYSNIIPSTGPVSAYGDMGIDFQTFKSFIEYGFISDKKVIFACSLQCDGIENKIKNDVAKIHENFSEITSVYYFCESNIAIGKQEQLKKQAKETTQIDLEILDGEAITSLLSDYDLYWIAEQYLGIQSDLYPMPKHNEWYKEYRDKWNKATPISAKDFLEIKCALRRSTFIKELKIDLPFWILKIETYINKPDLDDLARRANYEIVVATLRGKNDIKKFDELLKNYFNDHKMKLKSSIEDGICLVMYAFGAKKFGSQVSSKLIHKWKNKILYELEELLKDNKNNPYLLYLKCQIESYMILLLDKKTSDEKKANQFLTLWIELINQNELHPLFPINKLSDLMDVFIDIPFLSDSGLYLTLTEKIDELNSKKYGDNAAAEQCRNRAIKFYNRKQYHKAIQQLHTTKIKWFQDKTIYGSMLATYLIGECYQKIGLTYASKYYYMLSIYLSIRKDDISLNKNLPRFLYSLACNDYLNGSWVKFFDILNCYFVSFYLHERSPLNLDTEEQQHLVCYASLINYLGSFEEEYKPFIKSIINKLECDNDLKDILLENLFDNLKNNKKDFSHYWKEYQKALSGRPFSDVGKDFLITFNTSGIRWKIRSENDWDYIIIAEEFASLTQIFLLELYEKDINHIKGDLIINIIPSDNIEAKIVEKPGNTLFEYDCFIPNLNQKIDDQNINNYLISILSCLTVVLDGFSLLKKEDILNILEDLFKSHIFNKFFFIGLYRSIYTNCYKKDFLSNLSVDSLCKFKKDIAFSSELDADLFQYNKIHDNFDKEKAENTIRSRYDNSFKMLNLLLKDLNKNSVFQANIKSLKEDGYLDWEIMSSLANIMLNIKVNEKALELKLDQNYDLYERKNITHNIISNPEMHNSLPNDLSDFLDRDRILMGIKMNYVYELNLWKLQQKCQTPKFNAIKDFLENRFMLGKIDVEHPNYFEKTSI